VYIGTSMEGHGDEHDDHDHVPTEARMPEAIAV
jgi:hypothetical protein